MDWLISPLQKSIALHTDKPIGLLNDVQAAVCAEYQDQDQSAVRNFVFITGINWRWRRNYS